MSEWQTLDSLPRDKSVIVRVVPTEGNRNFAKWPPEAHAAYIDDAGNILNYETMDVDTGLWGQYWICTHWMPFPSAALPTSIKKATPDA